MGRYMMLHLVIFDGFANQREAFDAAVATLKESL